MEIIVKLTDEQLDEIARRVAELRPSEIRPRLLDVRKAAQYLGISGDAVREHVRHKTIPTVRANRRVLFDVYDLDQWIDQHKCDRE